MPSHDQRSLDSDVSGRGGLSRRTLLAGSLALGAAPLAVAAFRRPSLAEAQATPAHPDRPDHHQSR